MRDSSLNERKKKSPENQKTVCTAMVRLARTQATNRRGFSALFTVVFPAHSRDTVAFTNCQIQVSCQPQALLFTPVPSSQGWGEEQKMNSPPGLAHCEPPKNGGDYGNNSDLHGSFVWRNSRSFTHTTFPPGEKLGVLFHPQSIELRIHSFCCCCSRNSQFGVQEMSFDWLSFLYTNTLKTHRAQ